MPKLESVSVTSLLAALERAEGKKETQRLMVAILYKRGPSVPMIADWFDLHERTVYDWLNRLEERSIQDAVVDDDRRGRPPKMGARDRNAFEEIVRRPPAERGYDHSAWTTALAQDLLREEFDVEYSGRHVQRLLKDAGLTPSHSGEESSEAGRQFWTPDPTRSSVDGEDR